MKQKEIAETRHALANKSDIEIKTHYGKEIYEDLMAWVNFGKLDDPQYFSSVEEIEIYVRENEPLLDPKVLRPRTLKTCLICKNSFTRSVYKYCVCQTCRSAVYHEWLVRGKSGLGSYELIMREWIKNASIL
jgi:hypothetical protein